MRIGIVGWGLEAQSAYRYFGKDHDYLIVNESKQADFPPENDKVSVRYLKMDKPVGISGQVEDLSYLKGIDRCDRVVFQPTSYFNLKKYFGNNPSFWSKATTVYDIFFEKCPTKNIIGVTGTKGKGTTSTLIARMLQAVGHKVHLGGNIGTPILDLLPAIQADDWVVWELANFQLKPASYSPHIGVCLMIVPEHMDWHPDMDDYVEAKGNLFRHQKTGDIAIYFGENEYSKRIASYSPGIKIPYFKPPGAYLQDDKIIIDEHEIIGKSEIKLLGEHNLQNVCAAVTAVWQVSQTTPPIKQVLSDFTGLEHRLEFVREVDGVKYYDDSFGTTPETAIVAMKSFEQPKIMILGGSDKGASFDEMANTVKNCNVKHAIVIGQIAEKITACLDKAGFQDYTVGLSKMTDIVAKARELAQPGDVVLLSAGAASFGLFKDYKDRGNQFKQSVQALS
jgi:UDP-N-acetylmuramoylalanine--D-glutamate ligase